LLALGEIAGVALRYREVWRSAGGVDRGRVVGGLGSVGGGVAAPGDGDAVDLGAGGVGGDVDGEGNRGIAGPGGQDVGAGASDDLAGDRAGPAIEAGAGVGGGGGEPTG